MQGALSINPFRLAGHNENPSARKFRGEIFDPSNGIAILQEWLNQKNIRPMLPDQFYRVIETMGATANMIPLLAFDDCSQSFLGDNGIADNHYAQWFRALLD
jgi:hypothetical protein